MAFGVDYKLASQCIDDELKRKEHMLFAFLCLMIVNTIKFLENGVAHTCSE